MKKHYLHLLLLFAFVFGMSGIRAQTGLTVGPPRLFFVANAGQNQIQYVDVTNPSKDYTLELGISLEDWEYSLHGDNVLKAKGTLPTTCADWISISESFFSLKPMETKRLQVSMQVPKDILPSDSTPVHTTMLFVTQLNPRVGKENEGANIRLAVRSGIKLYHRLPGREMLDLEVTDFRYRSNDSLGRFLELDYHVTGNSWMQGRMRVEFINQATGQKVLMDDVDFYCLPHDKRKQYVEIPRELITGEYVASAMFFYGETDVVKAAELEFDHVQADN